MRIALVTLALLLSQLLACRAAERAGVDASTVNEDATRAASLNTLVLPADRLALYKASLPKVAYPRLQQIFESADTIWYDADSMTKSYQKSTGGPGFWGTQANSKWIENIPSFLNAEGRRFVNPEKGTWVFPFATTAGTDDSTNVEVANFLSLPRSGSDLQPIAITVRDDPRIEAGSRFWSWTYPNGTVVGEVIFVKDGQGKLLASEVRIRTRYAGGWAANVYRPFPRASDLSDAVKSRRPSYRDTASLQALVTALDNSATLTKKGLHAATLKGTFDQDGYVDVLPDFGDAALVRELLTQTEFKSAYATAWKEAGGEKTFAPTTKAALSIVPVNYTAGVIEVSDTSCMRCHKETAKLIDNYTDSLVLYGEIWGKDAIFSFQPFDKRYYDQLTVEGIEDNRHIDPKLSSAGVFKQFSKAPTGPFYDRTGP